MASNNDLDLKLMRLMFNAIRSAEIQNVKTQKKDEKGMVRAIVDYVNKKVGEEMRKDED